eukprot:610567-Prymnesium_polylepis.1
MSASRFLIWDQETGGTASRPSNLGPRNWRFFVAFAQQPQPIIDRGNHPCVHTVAIGDCHPRNARSPGCMYPSPSPCSH